MKQMTITSHRPLDKACPRYESLPRKSLDGCDSVDQRNDHDSKESVYYPSGGLRNLSDESDLFSGISNRKSNNSPAVMAMHPVEHRSQHACKLSRKQLELLQRHNVVSNGGLLLVDPKRNEKVCLKQNNHSLTEHDLFIVQDGYSREDDEFSMVTEVTYEIEKSDLNLAERPLVRGTNNLPNFELPKPSCVDIYHLLNLGSSCMNIHTDIVTEYPSYFNDNIIVCIISTYSATSDEIDIKHSKQIGLRCSWNEPTLSHKLGAKFTEGYDGRAYVRQVLEGSHVASCGIRKGDVVSFAVPLDSSFQGHEDACDLVRKLEYIGMRTTYRELFDMFLSKTTSGWPVALVLRREKDGKSLLNSHFSFKFQKAIRQLAAFIHELVSKSREYDYQQVSSGTHEYIRGNIESFFPRPILRGTSIASLWASVASALEEFSGRDYQLVVPPISINQRNNFSLISPLLWRRQFLKTSMNEIAAFVFSAFSRSCVTETSIILVRNYDGSWSDPLFVKCVVSESKMLHLMGYIEYFMLIHDPTILSRLFLNQKVDLYSKGQYVVDVEAPQTLQSYQNTTFAKYHDSFYIAHDVMFTIVPSQTDSRVNAPPSSSMPHGSYPICYTIDIACLHGALKRIEMPATMIPHPTVPRNLSKFTTNWELSHSCCATSDLEHPVHCINGTTLRQYLDTISNDISMLEEAREIDIFHQKFVLFLLDGFSVYYLHSSIETTSVINGTLLMSILPGEKIESGRLLFTINNSTTTLIELDVSLISGITHPQQCSVNLESRMRNRLLTLETRDRKKISFLARTSKDAHLCLCGFKLVMEKILQANMEIRTQLTAL